MTFIHELKRVFSISTALANNLIEAGNIEIHKASSIVRHTKDYPNHIYFILSGTAFLTSHRDGEEHFYTFLTQGQIPNIMGLFYDDTIEFRAEALTDIRLLSIPTKKSIELFESNSEFARLIAKNSARNVFILNNILEIQRLKDQVVKVKSLVFLLFNLTDQSSISITTKQVANLLSISRNTAVKAMKELEEKNVIQMGYGKIEKGETWDNKWNPIGHVVFPTNSS